MVGALTESTPALDLASRCRHPFAAEGPALPTNPRPRPSGSNFGFQTHDRHSFGTGLSAGGLARMQTQTQYRDFAEECDRLAKQAKTERERMVLNEMAEVWRSLAEEADRRYFKKSG